MITDFIPGLFWYLFEVDGIGFLDYNCSIV